MKGSRFIAFALGSAALVFCACSPPKDPAQKAGQQLDRAFPSEGKGPFQHSGENLDKARPDVNPPAH